jgi:DNA-binding beta-propeller fold protein YncE
MRATLAALILLSTCPERPTGPAPGTLVVLNKSDATVSLLDGASDELLETLPVRAGPHEVAAFPDATRVIVCNLWYHDPAGSPCGALFNLTIWVEFTWGL